jgi:competence protein ComEC
MIQWIPYAFVRLVLFFIAGIGFGILAPALIPIKVALLIIGLLQLFYIGILILQRSISWRLNPGWVGLLIVFCLGYLAVAFRSVATHGDHLLNQKDTVGYYKAVITSAPSQGSTTWKQVARVKAIYTHHRWSSASGKVLLYVSKLDFPSPFKYGDVLLVAGNPRILSPPANPYEFDYKRFLSSRLIYYQQFVRKDQIVRTGFDPPSRIKQFALNAREWMLEIFRRYIPGARELSVASALVLGDKGGLDDEQAEAFSAAGAMHVLAVSGLHVGILYGILLILFRPIRRTLPGKWALAFCSVCVLWSYAFLTGLSPSVLRATTMFTFLALAEPWGRRTNIFNTLALSALVLLLFDPYLILSVGFQLSYAAVFGIVYLYPRLISFWQPASWILEKLWQISCVSLSAQLATFPIALFYFHQFPVYFLLANLFVIPLAFLILILGIGIFASAAWSYAAYLVGNVLSVLILVLNKGVVFIEGLPFSVIQNIYISPLQCWLLIGLVCASVLLCESRRFEVVYLCLLFALVFGFTQWERDFHEIRKHEFIVYQVPGHYAMELIHNGRSYFFSDSTLQRDRKGIAFHINPNRMAMGVSEVFSGEGQPFAYELKGARLIRWKDITIMHIFGSNFSWQPIPPVDCVIVSQNAVKTLGGPDHNIHIEQLVVDGSNSAYVLRMLEKQAAERSIAFYATQEDGAYEVEI